MNKKGVYYLIDALIFAAILIAAILLFPPQAEQRQVIQFPSTYVSTDLLNVINEMTVEELQSLDDAYLNQIVLEQNISDANATVLIGMGALWAQNDDVSSGHIANITLAEWLPSYQGYGVFIEDEPLITTSNPPTARYATSWKIVSGIEKTKPYQGFVAQAKATRVSINGTRVYTMSPQGAGWEDGRVYLTKYVNLSNITIVSATLVLSTHADANNNDIQVDVNACEFERSDFVWQFGSSDGNVGNATVTGCLIEGDNEITLELNNDGYNAHLHPGTQLIVEYVSDEILDAEVVDVTQRFYFDRIVSVEDGNDASGVWSILPFFIPSDAQNLTVDMRIVGDNIRDYESSVHGCDIVYVNSKGRCNFPNWNSVWSSANNYDYLLFVNDGTPLFTDGSPLSNPVYTYDSGDLNDNLVNGTNIVGVYFNNYGDYAWGEGTTELYVDPIDDPDGSSHVQVNYTLPVSIPFGMIEVSDIQSFGGTADDDKTVSFSFPSEAQIKSDVNVNVIQQFSWQITEWVDTFNPPTTQLFDSPSARAVPSTIFNDAESFALSSLITNYIRVQDSGNEILPSSSIEYKFYVPSFVGFGDVFSSQADAEADAIARLDAVTGTYITVEGVETTVNSINDVPTLWGPSIAEVRVWE